MATKKADGILDCLNRRTALKTQEATLYAALIRLHVDHCVQFSATHTHTHTHEGLTPTGVDPETAKRMTRELENKTEGRP